MWVERQLTETMGVRAGFVYKTEDDLITNNYQLERGLSAYTVPFPFMDRGADNVLGSADDKTITLHGYPDRQRGELPDDAVRDEPRLRTATTRPTRSR